MMSNNDTANDSENKPVNIINAEESDSDNDLDSLLDLSIHEYKNLVQTFTDSSSRQGMILDNSSRLESTYSIEQSSSSSHDSTNLVTRRSSEIKEVTVIRRDSMGSTLTFTDNVDTCQGGQDNTNISRKSNIYLNRKEILQRRRSVSFNERVDRLTYDGDSCTETSEVLLPHAPQLDAASTSIRELDETSLKPHNLLTRRNSICTSDPSQEISKQLKKKNNKKFLNMLSFRKKEANALH